MVDPDVGRLDIPVHDPQGVGIGQGLGQVGDDLGGLVGRQRAVLGQPFVQAAALDQGHGDVVPIAGPPRLVDRHDPGMPQPRLRPGLAQEPLERLGSVRSTPGRGTFSATSRSRIAS